MCSYLSAVDATGMQTIGNNHGSWVTGRGSRGSWISSLMGQMGHGSHNVKHCRLWSLVLPQLQLQYYLYVVKVERKHNIKASLSLPGGEAYSGQSQCKVSKKVNV